MSYRSLDADRQRAIVEAMERVAAAPLEPGEVAAAAAREVAHLTGASQAWLERINGGSDVHLIAEELADVAESISVPVEGDGCQIALLTVATQEDEGFSDADVEALRLLGRCVSSMLRDAISHAEAS